VQSSGRGDEVSRGEGYDVILEKGKTFSSNVISREI
jgi:hypothetical protein